MIEFVTLNVIITDLLNIIRGSNLSQSEPISKRQVEAWVHQYRSVLLKQDLDKGKHPNPAYIQTIQALELEEVDESEGSSISTFTRTFRTKLQVPKVLDLNFKPGFMYIGTLEGNEIQFSPEGRARYQKFRKYTSNDKISYLKDDYIYVHNDKELRYITVRGVFEVPTEVNYLNNPNETKEAVDIDSPYPIPINMIPTLKEMILQKELGIEYKAFSDTINDSAAKVQSNIESNTK